MNVFVCTKKKLFFFNDVIYTDNKSLLFFLFCLDHYNLSIIHVRNSDEGIFQCQIQRTMQANEARSERIQLTLIGL
jgi:hypothetical protein